jgi:hypothetical protein
VYGGLRWELRVSARPLRAFGRCRIKFGEAARTVVFGVFLWVRIVTPNAPVALEDGGFAHKLVVGLAV